MDPKTIVNSLSNLWLQSYSIEPPSWSLKASLHVPLIWLAPKFSCEINTRPPFGLTLSLSFDFEKKKGNFLVINFSITYLDHPRIILGSKEKDAASGLVSGPCQSYFAKIELPIEFQETGK